MAENLHDYTMTLFKQDGDALGRVALTVDWEPALEWTTFTGQRKGQLPLGSNGTQTSILPVWHESVGEPFVSGFQVRIRADEHAGTSATFTTAYFKSLAQQASLHFMEQGKLEAGDTYQYAVSAEHGQPHAQPDSGPKKIVVEHEEAPLDLRDGSLAGLMDRAQPWGDPDESDMPLFLPWHVVEELAEATRAARELETGGILIGHLRHDSSAPEIFVEVTAQIPAIHARSELTQLAFTDEVWTAVQAALDLRRQDEIWVGWWHCHNFMKKACANCEKSKEKSCNDSATFMSSQDCLLHRTVFPKAYSASLVISDSPCTGMSVAAFGWGGGVIAQRGFHILGGPEPLPELNAVVGGNDHAKI